MTYHPCTWCCSSTTKSKLPLCLSFNTNQQACHKHNLLYQCHHSATPHEDTSDHWRSQHSGRHAKKQRERETWSTPPSHHSTKTHWIAQIMQHPSSASSSLGSTAATTSMCIPEIDPHQTVDTLHTIAAVHLHCVHPPSEPPLLSRHYESCISVHISIAANLLQPAAHVQWQSTNFPEDRVTLQKDSRQWSRLAFLFRLFPRKKSNPKSIDIHN
jgi:hypothetical protein